jgi:deoxyinosine 3'endonuclease (endonuclease V)
VDGYVTLGAEQRPGLGQHLHAALGGQIPVVGVAKTRFAGVAPQVVPVRRGQSQNPLYVTSVGLPVAEAAQLVADMHGKHRFPTLLKLLDDLTKRVAYRSLFHTKSLAHFSVRGAFLLFIRELAAAALRPSGGGGAFLLPRRRHRRRSSA